MKKHRDSDRSSGDMLEGDTPRKNSSCFSNIKIFLISECALMLAQGTVGAYLVSATPALHGVRVFPQITNVQQTWNKKLVKYSCRTDLMLLNSAIVYLLCGENILLHACLLYFE